MSTQANIKFFTSSANGSRRFSWVCPDCGGTKSGALGDVPVSGWEAPRWVLTGTEDAPTLRPSLGCYHCMTGGQGLGHFWCNDGALVRT